ncbi:MAG: hypothetical protein ABSH16_04835 [Sedimentisphaerales bacterium]
MSDKQDKTSADYLLDAYQNSGLSRRRFLRRIGLKITGAGVLFTALAQKAKSCPCTPCNTACDVGCNVSCDLHICDSGDTCVSINVCREDTCLAENTCRRNVCTRNRCEMSNVCTSDDTCELDVCPGTADVCETNTCYTSNPCGVNICHIDDFCLVSNICSPTDIDCGYFDISCPVGNCVAPNAPW